MENLRSLEEKLGYRFQNGELLLTAVTHSSFANEQRRGQPFNERLEFLGDSVLSIVVSEYLFSAHKDLPEGELTRTRAALVCEGSCFEFAKKIDLGRYMRLGRGEELSGGRERSSILADAFEAVIAAIYLDGGLEAARAFILPFVKAQHVSQEDYKTRLQEIIQQNPEERLRYVVTGEFGPDHNKRFTVEVHLNSNVLGKGTGHSKKAAEQQAARQALELFGDQT
ncbi:MAG: ribonuclease III [Pygmaiobacter massiliensis]|nr:ribonuclease III [Pygmaiobacter massiliensis]